MRNCLAFGGDRKNPFLQKRISSSKLFDNRFGQVILLRHRNFNWAKLIVKVETELVPWRSMVLSKFKFKSAQLQARNFVRDSTSSIFNNTGTNETDFCAHIKCMKKFQTLSYPFFGYLPQYWEVCCSVAAPKMRILPSS